MHILLKIPHDAEPALRARLTYAFRLFCAIYGHRPEIDQAKEGIPDAIVCYLRPSSAPPGAERATVWLSPGYRVRALCEPAPPPVRYECNGVTTLLHSAPASGLAPDWLGEIFEWVSCADEYSVTKRDHVNRPLYEATYFGRHRIDTRVPYAAIAMQCLQHEIRRVVPRAADRPRGLPGSAAHIVIPTHDVDYFPMSRKHAVNRLLRNAVISSLLARNVQLGVRQAAMAVRVALGGGTDPLDLTVALAEEESRRGIGASYHFLARHEHRRDAGYTLAQPEVVETMRNIELQGLEIGIHGSYTCLDHPRSLEHEVAILHGQGFRPQGGRQHWLRYTLDRLIPAMERSGLAYDMSIGWPDRIGFRAGACFAFPPYNFSTEGAATFLEIPLVLMDQALQLRRDGLDQMFAQATEVLAASRRMGWGGISLLWHPTAFGDGWLPREVGELYWSLADSNAGLEEEWIGASSFVARARKRYADAGLLPESEPSAELAMLPVKPREGADLTEVEERRQDRSAPAHQFVA